MLLNRAILPVAAAILCLACAAARASDGQERAVSAGASLVGQPAPAVKLHTIEGREIDLGQLYGRKPVYLKFWATWCVPCREQMPHFEKTYEQRHRDMEVVAVNAGFNDSVEDIRTYRKQMKLTMPMVLDDGRLADAFHLRVTPQHIVIGRDGRILYIGHLADDRLEQALASAVAEKPAALQAASRVTAVRPYAVGETIEPLNVRTTDGASLPLSDPAGSQGTVLAFISPWCESYLAQSRPKRAAACRAGRESLEQFVKANPQLRVIGVASGLWADRSDVAEYQQKHGLTVPVTVDESGALFRRFGVREVPTFIALDGRGRLLTRSGQLPAAGPQAQVSASSRHAVG